MKQNRDDLLGSAMLLWVGAALLALYLLCNPKAAMLQEPLDPTRLWGAVLGLTLLGAALPARSLLPWLLFLGTLPLLFLPTPLNRRLGPAALLGVSAMGTLLLVVRRLGRKGGSPRGKKGVARRKEKNSGGKRPAITRRPGRRLRPRARTERGHAPKAPTEEVKGGG